MEENALQKTGRDRSMDVLRALAIILMVYGHLGGLPLGWPFNCFPLYSYHMPLFLFVSGYLFHDILFRDYGRFLKKKTLTLALPLIGWNIVYAVILSLLNARGQFSCLPPVEQVWTVHNLFIEPFIGGHQYMLNLATWFVGMLYVSLVIYGLLHVALKRIPDWGMLLFYFGIGVLGLWGSAKHLQDQNRWLLLVFHVSQGMFYIHLGRCFRRYIEPFFSRFNKWLVASVLLVVWYFSLRYFNAVPYIMVWMSYNNRIMQPLIAGAMGCMFWKTLADIIVDYVRPNRLETLISQSSWQIMTHHLLVRFAWDWVFICYILKDVGQLEVLHNTFWYMLPIDWFNLSIFLCIGVPMLWYVVWTWLKSRLVKPFCGQNHTN